MNDLVLGKEFHDSNSQNIKLSYDPQDILVLADKGENHSGYFKSTE